MQIEMYESELRKVADSADVDEMLKNIAIQRRLQEDASKTKRRLVELDGIIASPKATQVDSAWQTALQGGDRYSVEPHKEAIEEHQFLSDNLAFKEAAIKESKAPLDLLLNRISLPFCQRERPLIAKELQTAVDCFQQGRAALARATDRRNKLDDMGIKTASIPVFVAPQIDLHVGMYFRWLKANFPEVKLP